MAATSILSCSGVCKTFTLSAVRSRHLQDCIIRRDRMTVRIPALQDVSFAVRSGEWVGIFGRNGSGKTTLLKMLAGLLAPDAGHIERHGQISCFFDLGVGFHDERSAEENVYFHSLFHGMEGGERQTFIERVRAFADLGEHWNLPFKCYSTGMRLRLGFAAATFTEADLYILDEVHAVGDQLFREKCWERFQAMKAVGKAAIFVTHEYADFQKICDRVMVLDEGNIVEERRLHTP